MAQGEEVVPVVSADNAAAIRSEEARLEIEGAEKVAGRVGERGSGGPGNKFGRVRGRSRGEELNVAEFHNTIKGADREAVPLRPPASTRMTHSFIGRMLEQELDVVDAGGGRVDTVRVGSG